MIKSFTAFCFGDRNTAGLLRGIDTVLTEATTRDPEKTMWAFAGFSPVFNGQPAFVAADGTVILNVQIRERLLPARVIKEAMIGKAIEYEQRQGYRPGRKQMAELKEEVTMALLPTSHIKPVDVPVMITREYLLIGATSARRIDTTLELLTQLFEDDKLSLVSIGYNYKVGDWLMDLLLNESTESGDFEVGEEVVLKGSQKSVARFKAIPASVEAINDRITAGMRPVELAVTYGERMSFKVTDQLLVKGIKFSDVTLKEAESSDAAEEFEGTAALVSQELNVMLNNLLAGMKLVDEPADDSSDDEDEL